MSNIVKYNSASNVMRFNFPVQWDPQLVTSATVTVANTDGTELLAATAATLQATTATRADVDRFSTTIPIDAAYAGTISIGDKLKIIGVGGSEVVIVKGYDSTARNVVIDNVLRNEYESGDAVYPMYATYMLDTTTVADYPNGLNFRVTWTPTGAGNATDEMYQVLQTVLELGDFEGKFRSLYPRAHDVLSKTPGRFDDAVEEAELRLYTDLKGDNMDMYQIKDQRVIAPVMRALAAYLYTLNGDKDIDDEREALKIDYQDRLQALKRLPIWVDINLDGIKDDEEITTHQTTFERGW